MKIILDGKTTITKLPKLLKEIIKEVQNKVGVEKAPVKIEKAEIVATFKVNGEPQYVTVVHDDLPELFTVAVKLDDNGNIEKSVDNEKETFLDDYSRAVAKGELTNYEEIQPSFKDEELEEIRTNDGGDIKESLFRHIETGNTVVRYYKNDKLVGEAGFETEPENVIRQEKTEE